MPKPEELGPDDGDAQMPDDYNKNNESRGLSESEDDGFFHPERNQPVKQEEECKVVVSEDEADAD